MLPLLIRPQGRHIADFADGEKADMLVLGSRGMGGVKVGAGRGGEGRGQKP